jgi:iron transport multicopper oxidase
MIFQINANQPVDNYWIRAPMLNGGSNPNRWYYYLGPDYIADSCALVDPENNFAVLRYVGAAPTEPTTATGSASGTLMQELGIVPLENPGAPGLPVNGGADVVFNLAFSVTGGNAAANTGVSWVSQFKLLSNGTRKPDSVLVNRKSTGLLTTLHLFLLS